MNSNLPPGVTESMIPGNRPEDAAFETWHDAKETELEKDIDSMIDEIRSGYQGGFEHDMEFDQGALAAEMARLLEELDLDGRVYQILQERRESE